MSIKYIQSKCLLAIQYYVYSCQKISKNVSKDAEIAEAKSYKANV